jgi:hypothetical protein
MQIQHYVTFLSSTVREPTVTSLNLEGILQVHTGLYEGAVGTFDRALSLAVDLDDRQVLTRNKITTLQKLGKYKASLELIQTLPTKDFKAKAAAALAFYKSKTK